MKRTSQTSRTGKARGQRRGSPSAAPKRRRGAALRAPEEFTAPEPRDVQQSASVNLTDAAELRALLRRHGLLHTNKSLGQHLLISRAALLAVVEAADLDPADAALEVGAGPGALTVELARRARRVVAVELDRAITPVLRESTAPYPNVEIVERNLLDLDPEAVFGAEPYKLVANLPYYITAATLRHFLEASNPPQLLVVMVQREVAERMAAPAGEMSLLSLSVQFYGRPQIVAQIPANAFYPPPKVDSAVVRVDLRSELPPAPLRERLFALAHAGFAEKRKQLHNSLARHLDVAPERIRRWLNDAEIDPARRAQTLAVAEWLRLAAISLADVAQLSGGELSGDEP